MSRLLAVVGTDTGVGKTVVACGVLAGLRNRGLRVAGFKPVETGLASAAPVWAEPLPDWQRLEGASGQRPGSALGVALALPAAPPAATREAGVALDLEALEGTLAALRHEHDVVLVEGAGGLEVPVAPGLLWGDLLGRWQPACLVVGHLGLGTINHTLLTLAGLRRRGLDPLGVLLNETSPRGPEVAHTPSLIAEFGTIVVFDPLPAGVIAPAAVAEHLAKCRVLDRLLEAAEAG